MKLHQDLNDLYYFVQVVDHGGFAAAGRALNMPRSKLSRRIGDLEQRQGVRLIQRSTRRFAVTELGQAYYVHCKAMLVEAEAAQNVIDTTHADPCGTVRMSCPVALLHFLIGPMLVSFAAKFPLVTIELLGMNRPVDVVGEGLDLAIRMRPVPLEDTGLTIRVLRYETSRLVASPSLLSKQGVPGSPVDLASWPSLGYGPPTEGHIWKLTGPDGTRAVQYHQPRFVSNDLATLKRAAVAGVGVVQLPSMVLAAELADGSLVQLLPDWIPNQEIIHVAFPTRRGLASSVRAVIDHLAEQFK